MAKAQRGAITPLGEAGEDHPGRRDAAGHLGSDQTLHAAACLADAGLVLLPHALQR